MTSRSRDKKQVGAYLMGYPGYPDNAFESVCVDVLEELASGVGERDDYPSDDQKSRTPDSSTRWRRGPMSPLDGFSSFRLLQRGEPRVYSVVPDRDDKMQTFDVEKRSVGTSRRRASSSIGSSSRSPSDSMNGATQRMLSPIRSRRRAGLYKVPNKVMRNICWVFITCIALFILNLVRMARASSAAVENTEPVPRPPPWESFPFLTRYYGGIRTIIPVKENVPEYPPREIKPQFEATRDASNTRRALPSPKVFNPYPDYSSREYLSEFEEVHECFLDSKNTIRIPKVHAYDGVPAGMPDPIFGSYNLLGIRDDVCFDRYGRLGPYGFGYTVDRGGIGAGLEGDVEGSEEVWKEIGQVDFQGVKWAEAQRSCAAVNAHRFKILEKPNGALFLESMGGVRLAATFTDNTTSPASDSTSSSTKKKLPRTALVIRTWSDYQYKDDDILNLRSLITELSLNSGGEFDVHLLVHVKDLNLPVFADPETYQKTIESSLPEEFWGMATLWTESQMSLLYPGLEETNFRNLQVHGVYRGLFQALQYFAHTHPEYDYFWHWEMDIRYTGHTYHLLSRLGAWADTQPRKGLWERNERFYIPSLHGDYASFSAFVEKQAATPLQDGTPADRPIRGPLRPSAPNDHFRTQDDPAFDSSSSWGTTEPADLITLNPLFNPVSTGWLLTDDYTGYNTTPPNTPPPRRVAILSASRLSRRLLHLMHTETAIAKHHTFTEMWPATTCLHHGLKAVYAPHPVLVDRNWPLPFLSETFNSGLRKEAGSSNKSVFNVENEHNMRGVTWYFNSGFAGNLWRRWFGVGAEGTGGADEERTEGRGCLRGVLVHPVKTS